MSTRSYYTPSLTLPLKEELVIHSRQLKKGLRPFRAYFQFVDNFTGRCPVLLMMPFQGIDFYERALALAQGIAPCVSSKRDQIKALKGRKQLIEFLS
jgi:hypothetical protein